MLIQLTDVELIYDAHYAMQDPFYLIQLSDCHLFAESTGKLLGLNTEQSLQQVLESIKTDGADGHQPSLFLATGDISQDASERSYQQFAQLMADWRISPLMILPGNHDDRSVMTHVLAEVAPQVWDRPPWRIIGLDTSVSGKVAGHLSQVQLRFLTEALTDEKVANNEIEHCLIFLHHHPVAISCDWLDQIGLQNTQALWQCIEACSKVRGISWGHVHQAHEFTYRGVKLFSAPSTCVQFKPLSRDFSIDETAPGYRWFCLRADGSIESGVHRVTHIKFEVDYSVKGY